MTSIADDVPVVLTKNNLERWRNEARAGIEPNEGWSSIIIALVDGCFNADDQAQRLSRQNDRYAVEIMHLRGRQVHNSIVPYMDHAPLGSHPMATI